MKARRLIPAILLILAVSGVVKADGFIVPVPRPPHPRPPHPMPMPPPVPFRGSWAVKHHHVAIRVRDQVASVSIDQAFVNTGQGVIEVEYFFPVPPGAAIDSMTLLVDGKEFTAKLLKAEEARKIYEETVRRMKDPALLEYAGFGLYKTSAFPLQPGKPAKVLVTYKNVCKRDRDLVEVWYPLNTEKFSAKPVESVEVVVDIKADSDITAVYSPTHDLNMQRKDPKQVIATYKAQGTLPMTDFQVFYKAADEAVGATMMTHMPEAGHDGYFMLLVSPNPRGAATRVAPKDIVMVFDHSGSMSGEKIAQAKEALSYILKNLNKDDRFNVIAYNDSVDNFYADLVPASEKNIAQALERVDALDATGGTDIDGALTAALNFPKEKRATVHPRPAYLIFLTDGQPTVGKTNEADILQDTKTANKVGARVFTFGVGYEPNVRLLDKLADENAGRSDYVKPKEAIEPKVSSLYNKIKNPVMTDLKVSVRDLKVRDLYPRKLTDLFDGDQVVVVGRYDCNDAGRLPGGDDGRWAELIVSGTYEGKERAFEYNVSVRSAGKDSRYEFVEKLWAVRRIGFLLDEIQLHGRSQEVVDEIVRLSMKYGIMTPYTSFLADERTDLASTPRLRAEAIRSTRSLEESSGRAGQFGAANRWAMKSADRAPAPAAMPGPGKGEGMGQGASILGYRDEAAYEADKKGAALGNVRQIGNQATYQRGNLWVASNAAKLDPGKDAEKIKVIQRFSDEYFELVRQNSAADNQVLASQRAGEQLLIVLGGQAYRIE